MRSSPELIQSPPAHTNGIEVAIAAVVKGAKIIEKHFTLDKRLKGPDHLDADPFLMPKFGLVAEFATDYAEMA